MDTNSMPILPRFGEKWGFAKQANKEYPQITQIINGDPSPLKTNGSEIVKKSLVILSEAKDLYICHPERSEGSLY